MACRKMCCCFCCRDGVDHSETRLDGKTVIITGGNTGIGKETAINIAKRGARVIIGCRNLKKGNAALEDICEASGSEQVFLEHLDLASFKSIRTFVENILQNESRLDILINNAGIFFCPFARTEDGFESQFGVNHLGHFLLTNLLLDLIKRSAPSRIVTVSSLAHTFTDGIDLEQWNKEEGYDRHRSYYWSKLANVLFMRELAKRLDGTGVMTYSLHPGVIKTEIDRNLGCCWRRNPLVTIFLKTPRQGAQTSIYCAVSEEVEGETGLYYSDCRVKSPSRAGMNDELARKLWDVSAELVKL